MLPVDEIFDVVVDSAFVGSRKPEPRIYEITLDRLGVPAPAARGKPRPGQISASGRRRLNPQAVDHLDAGRAARTAGGAATFHERLRSSDHSSGHLQSMA